MEHEVPILRSGFAFMTHKQSPGGRKVRHKELLTSCTPLGYANTDAVKGKEEWFCKSCKCGNAGGCSLMIITQRNAGSFSPWLYIIKLSQWWVIRYTIGNLLSRTTFLFGTFTPSLTLVKLSMDWCDDPRMTRGSLFVDRVPYCLQIRPIMCFQASWA